MKYESYQALKQELLAERTELHARALFEGAPQPPSVAVGLAAGDGVDEFKLAIRSPDPEAASRMAERVHGDADVRVIAVKARTTPRYFQSPRDPLEPGSEISPQGSNWVGTLGLFVYHPVLKRRGFLSNAHVMTDMGRLPRGTKILQPFAGRVIGSVWADIPVSVSGHNPGDAAWAVLQDGVRFTPGFSAAFGDYHEVYDLTPDDLGREVRKAGRTTALSVGKYTAIDIDDLAVGYGEGRVFSFDNTHEISGGPSSDFSDSGDSGSGILAVFASDEAKLPSLLFAGGFDQTGEDFTYALPVRKQLELLGLELLRAA